MFGNVHSSSAVFAAECQSLQQSEKDENYRSCNANRAIAWQESDRGCRAPHYQQRYEESELTADNVTDSAEDERAERTHRKTDSECCERLEKVYCGVAFGIELSRNDR